MAGTEEHHLLLYKYVDHVLERRGPYREAHLARLASERERGRAGHELADRAVAAGVTHSAH